MFDIPELYTWFISTISKPTHQGQWTIQLRKLCLGMFGD